MTISIRFKTENPIDAETWSWNEYYKKKFYGDTNPYNGEEIAELKIRAEKRMEEIKKTIDKAL